MPARPPSSAPLPHVMADDARILLLSIVLGIDDIDAEALHEALSRA